MQAQVKSNAPKQTTSRRQLLRNSSVLAGAALAMNIPHVHAAEDSTIRLALIGCGGRGSGAAVNAFSSPKGPVKLYAMADLFDYRLQAAHKNLSSKYAAQMDVPKDRQFIGFDAYKKAIDILRPGDVAMLTGYAGFRPAQLEYAVQKGINVFMEKSFAADPPGCRRVIKAGEEAEKKGVKIAAGLQCRHSKARQELLAKIRDGEMGEIILIRGYRMQPVGSLGARRPDETELAYQIRNFVHFLWVSGGLYAEMDIHQFDEYCWIKDAQPVQAHGIGGRIHNSTDKGQNLDSMHLEYTFPDGTKATHNIRWLPKCYNEFATYIHGTKCAAQFSGWSHASDVRMYKDQRISNDNIVWKANKEERSLWEAEWDDLLDSIRNNKPHNEAKRAALTNLADIMGRAAIHSGQTTTWEQTVNSDFQFCPYADTMTHESQPPIKTDERGHYPVPVPGVWKEL